MGGEWWEVRGTVAVAQDVASRQLLTVADAGGDYHTLVVDPSAFDGMNVLVALPGLGAAEGIARLVLGGCPPKIPEASQLNILAAAVLARSTGAPSR